MGLEVGWYLRLSRADEIRALVRPTAVAQLEDQARMNTHWIMDVALVDDHAEAVFRRRAPGSGVAAGQGTGR